MERKDIFTPSLQDALQQMQALVQQGYIIDPSNLPCMWFGQYRVVMIRTELSAQEHRKRLQDAVDNKPVLTPAQRMEKARAGKAQKAQQEESNDSN